MIRWVKNDVIQINIFLIKPKQVINKKRRKQYVIYCPIIQLLLTVLKMTHEKQEKTN